MKTKILILSFLLINTFSIAQISYYDALELKRHTQSEKVVINRNDTVLAIIVNYFPIEIQNQINGHKTIVEKYIKGDSRYTAQDSLRASRAYFNTIDSLIDSNPFFTISKTVHSFNPSFISSSKHFLSTISGLNVTSFADGMAKFLVERAKQELSITFFERFKEELESQDQLQILFPSTHKNLHVLGEQIYQFSGYIELLRSGFQKDMANLLTNLNNLVDHSSMDSIFHKFPEIRIMLSDGLYFSMSLKNGEHIGDVFNNYSLNKAKSEQLETLDINLFPAIQTLNIFSQSLLKNSESDYWVSVSEIQKLLDDETTFRIYMGLVYQQVLMLEKKQGKEIEFNGKKLTDLMADANKSYEILMQKYGMLVQHLVSSGQQVTYAFKNVKKLQNAEDKKPGYEEYYALMDASINFIELINTVNKNITDTVFSNTKKIDKYLLSARSAANIYVDINQKNYVSGIAELSYLYSELVLKQIENDSLLAYHQNIAKFIMKYGSFIALVAKAETSDDVKAAIEAVALPAGSASIKRRTAKNVAVNAYVGLASGGSYNFTTDNWGGDFGLNAPIGITLSKGFDKIGSDGKLNKKCSHSLLLSFIDIGALTAFRFGDSDTEEIPNINLGNILSPGAFWVVGFKNSPVSWGLGAQISPQLQNVKADVVEIDSNINLMIRTFIAIDIPLLNLYTKSK